MEAEGANEEAKFKNEDEIIKENYEADTRMLSKKKQRLHFSTSYAELIKLSQIIGVAEKEAYLAEISNVRKKLLKQIESGVLDDNGLAFDDLTHRAMQREVWVLNGVLEHDFSITVLQKVAENFDKVDAVPQGYFYPEIYA